MRAAVAKRIAANTETRAPLLEAATSYTVAGESRDHREHFCRSGLARGTGRPPLNAARHVSPAWVSGCRGASPPAIRTGGIGLRACVASPSSPRWSARSFSWPRRSAGARALRLSDLQVVGTHNSFHLEPSPAERAVIVRSGLVDPSPLDYSFLGWPSSSRGRTCGRSSSTSSPTAGRPLRDAAAARAGREGDVRPPDAPTGIEGAAPAGLRLPIHLPDARRVPRRGPELVGSPSRARPPRDPARAQGPPASGAEHDPARMDPRQDVDALDREIQGVFPRRRLIVPDDVRGRWRTLEDAVRRRDWQTLDRSRGKVLFVLISDTARHRRTYLVGHASLRGRILFTSSAPGRSEAAVVKVDDPTGRGASRIRSLVRPGLSRRHAGGRGHARGAHQRHPPARPGARKRRPLGQHRLSGPGIAAIRQSVRRPARPARWLQSDQRAERLHRRAARTALSAVQILYVNLATDGLPAASLDLDDFAPDHLVGVAVCALGLPTTLYFRASGCHARLPRLLRPRRLPRSRLRRGLRRPSPFTRNGLQPQFHRFGADVGRQCVGHGGRAARGRCERCGGRLGGGTGSGRVLNPDHQPRARFALSGWRHWSRGRARSSHPTPSIACS
jgi:hypothetical protein